MSIQAFDLLDLPYTKCNIYSCRVPRNDGSFIESYICTEKAETISSKPLLVLLNGSAPKSVFIAKENGISLAFLFHSLVEYIEQWNIVLIEKRCIKLYDDYKNPESAGKDYMEYDTSKQRIEDANQVIEHLVLQGIYDNSKLLVVGHSEGTHIAAGVSLINKRITHLGVFGCSAGHGLYDCLVNLRKDLASKKISESEFQYKYGKFISDFKNIPKNKDSVEDIYWGHPYRRWSSYWNNLWIEEFVKLDIPVFIGVASLDRNSTAEGSDWLIAEFIKAGKNNLTYKHYLDCDHGFIRYEEGKAINLQPLAAKDLIDWVFKSR